jgi:hypothetical protein
MKRAAGLALLASVIATPAFADAPPVHVDGVFRCVMNCRGGLVGARTFVGQSGWKVNLVNEAGDPSIGYIQWPSRIWVDRWNEGANVSPDGTKIQFDNGTVWVRELPVVPILRPYR